MPESQTTEYKQTWRDETLKWVSSFANTEKNYNVSYEGEFIGRLIPDLIVANEIVIDTKVVSAFNESHLAQMLGYLNITGLKTGLLLNFKYSKLGIKRITSFEK